MMTSINKTISNKTSLALPPGFTLFELIVVLTIISATVGVILPYATKSNHILTIRQDALNIAEAFKYSINLAQNKNKKIKVSIDLQNKSHQILQENSNNEYEAIQGYFGAIRQFNEKISIDSTQGMTNQANKWQLIIKPNQKFPHASLELRSKELIVKIVIAGKRVTIEETSI